MGSICPAKDLPCLPGGLGPTPLLMDRLPGRKVVVCLGQFQTRSIHFRKSSLDSTLPTTLSTCHRPGKPCTACGCLGNTWRPCTLCVEGATSMDSSWKPRTLCQGLFQTESRLLPRHSVPRLDRR